jgi:hypothetical protein
VRTTRSPSTTETFWRRIQLPKPGPADGGCVVSRANALIVPFAARWFVEHDQWAQVARRRARSSSVERRVHNERLPLRRQKRCAAAVADCEIVNR